MRVYLYLIITISLLTGCNRGLKPTQVAAFYDIGISEADLDREYGRVIKNFLPPGYELSSEESLDFKRDILDKLIKEALFNREMDRLGISIDRDFVKERLNQAINQYGSEDNFYEAVLSAGFSKEEIINQFNYKSREVQLYTYIESLDLEIPESDIKKYYETRAEFFREKARVSSRHILIKNESDDSLKRVKEIKKEIESGLGFDQAAKLYSQGPSGKNGGVLPPFTKGEMIKEFEDVAFNIEPGTVSDPLLTQFGYHLILVEERTEDGIKSLDKSREFILSILKEEKYLNRLKEEGNLTLIDWAVRENK